MFAGHIGAALAIGRAEPRVNVGVLIGAALLLDLLLWSFILLGWESVQIPADFARTHQPVFVFPYSHSLLGSLVWSVLAGAGGFVVFSGTSKARWQVAGWVGAAVLSHWLLDVLVHAPELPLAGEGSFRFGLGLWNDMPLGLAVEAMVLVVGLGLYLRGAALSRGRKIGLLVLALAALIFTVLGMTVAPAPPSATAMAGSSLLTIVLVSGLAGRLGCDRDRTRHVGSAESDPV